MVLKMAWRNIWRSRRRTLVTVGAMTLALTILILYTSLVEGYLRDIERNILELELGDVQVHAENYLNKPSIYDTIEDSDSLVAQLMELDYPASARLLGGGLVASGDSSAGASLRGIEIEQDARVSKIGEHVVDGRWLDPSEPSGVVLGRRLAHTLNAKVGDELVMLSQAVDGSMANDLYHVKGVLASISDGTDRTGVFMTAEAFRNFFGLDNGAHQVVVRRPVGKELDVTATTVAGLSPSSDVKTWRDLMPTLATMLDSTRGMIQVVFFVIYIVVAILILNAMLMAVFERIREFGVLKAIGVSPKKVLTIIVTESSIQTLLAIITGLTLSLPGLWYLVNYGIDTGALGGTSMMGIAWNQMWYGVVTPWSFIAPVITLIIMASLAVIYPALKASRISPVEAMRHQ
jgi:ABC-type lipoprotein release transport system permease subunit